MKFTKQENDLIWESYGKLELDADFENDDEMGDDDFESDSADFANDGLDDDFDEMGHDEDHDMEGADVVMEFEPEGSVEMEDHRDEVLVTELKKLAEYSEKLYHLKDVEFDKWMIASITVASTYVSDVWHRLDAKYDLNKHDSH